ncbi:MAG: TetR/AcrR family transcriptional regulator [Geminicoccaceae bacterium]|jgi:AcrR family transcriptional regulator
MAGRKPLDRDTLSIKALDVAETIIGERGLSALNARELAQGVGCSVGSLYNMFGSLDRLVRILNTRTLEKLYEAMKTAVPKRGSPEDRMAALACAYIEFAAERPHLWRAVFDHKMPEGNPKVEWYGESIERMASLAVKIISPLFKPEELWAARHVATIIWSGVHGICALSLADNLAYVTKEDSRDLARDLVRGYLAGISHGDLSKLFRRD